VFHYFLMEADCFSVRPCPADELMPGLKVVYCNSETPKAEHAARPSPQPTLLRALVTIIYMILQDAQACIVLPSNTSLAHASAQCARCPGQVLRRRRLGSTHSHALRDDHGSHRQAGDDVILHPRTAEHASVPTFSSMRWVGGPACVSAQQLQLADRPWTDNQANAFHRLVGWPFRDENFPPYAMA
jgi:hypothetical protein